MARSLHVLLDDTSEAALRLIRGEISRRSAIAAEVDRLEAHEIRAVDEALALVLGL